ncbi:hypothetical protein [Methanoregula sp.]|uniref:hypothetical protein n=1 Tax=Methanoregula sp. TaxID=2052170 RepID=UPI0026355998|nr:hypothetical protein [Methanoregula sp.]MDD5143441.1 hypothetical protein [Methanoregula sp.]
MSEKIECEAILGILVRMIILEKSVQKKSSFTMMGADVPIPPVVMNGRRPVGRVEIITSPQPAATSNTNHPDVLLFVLRDANTTSLPESMS